MEGSGGEWKRSLRMPRPIADPKVPRRIHVTDRTRRRGKEGI
jgi:hypothetical protein